MNPLCDMRSGRIGGGSELTTTPSLGQIGRMAFGSSVIEKALARPSGARFFKCALQVNPFEYYKRHKKGTTFATEDAYNTALVEALVAAGMEVSASEKWNGICISAPACS